MKFVVSFLLLAFLTLPAQAELLLLSLGESKRISLSHNRVVFVGSKKLLYLKKEGSSLIVRAKNLGTTSLNVGSKSYRVLIVSAEKKQKIKILDEFLKNLWGLDWDFKEKKISVLGELNRISDWVHLSPQ